jgi:hypothetical protein
MELFAQLENRDPLELLPADAPEPIPYEEQRAFVRAVLAEEVDLRALGTKYVDAKDEGRASREYREQLNLKGSPSQAVSAGYQWAPGGELTRRAVNL